MKTTQRVLAILALLILATQTVRHAYVRWFEPRTSVLDRFDRPLSDQIAAAASLQDLLRLYEPVRADADRVRKASEGKPESEALQFSEGAEPFRSERELRQAIETWEGKAKEVHAVSFYWSVGLLFLLLGMAAYRWGNRWYGLAAEITAFAEFIYWTSPSLFGGGVREFDRLLSHKILLSLASLLLLVIVVRIQAPFADDRGASSHAI